MAFNYLNANEFILSSESFDDNSSIPSKYVNLAISGGKNISPQLAWQNPPEGTKSYAIVCVDIAPVANNWIHWAVFNIPPATSFLEEGASGNSMPKGSIELNNSFRTHGYGGPQPPSGTGIHNYIFTIYALNIERLELRKNFLNYDAIQALLCDKVISEATYCGTFENQ